MSVQMPHLSPELLREIENDRSEGFIEYIPYLLHLSEAEHELLLAFLTASREGVAETKVTVDEATGVGAVLCALDALIDKVRAVGSHP